jgi:hypothetical protein
MANFEVVGISGKAGSGKDYISQNFLIPLGYKQFSFAWHFKVWLIGKGEATHEEVFFTKPPHVRKLLQEEGTERGRNVYGENVWCNTAGEWMRVLAENCGITKFVIPDVRFPNEVEFIQSVGGKVYRVIAPTRSANNNLNEEARRHISETALDEFSGFDGFIMNDPEVADQVQSQVIHLLNHRDSCLA